MAVTMKCANLKKHAEMLETHAIFSKTLSAPILQCGSEHQGLRKSLEHNAVSWSRNSTQLL